MFNNDNSFGKYHKMSNVICGSHTTFKSKQKINKIIINKYVLLNFNYYLIIDRKNKIF